MRRGRRRYDHLLVVGEGAEETVHVLEHLTRASLHVVDLGFSLLVEDGHLGIRGTTDRHSLAVHLNGEHAENVEKHVFVAGGSNVLDGETDDVGQVAPAEEERCDIETDLVAERGAILLVLLGDGEEHREELLRLFCRQFIEVVADLATCLTPLDRSYLQMVCAPKKT